MCSCMGKIGHKERKEKRKSERKKMKEQRMERWDEGEKASVSVCAQNWTKLFSCDTEKKSLKIKESKIKRGIHRKRTKGGKTGD